MVNASLNWASIVGIVLAVGGALLYFMRSFKPALARDYDVFFAAVGLLCGGILFFQGCGWIRSCSSASSCWPAPRCSSPMKVCGCAA